VVVLCELSVYVVSFYGIEVCFFVLALLYLHGVLDGAERVYVFGEAIGVV